LVADGQRWILVMSLIRFYLVKADSNYHFCGRSYSAPNCSKSIDCGVILPAEIAEFRSWLVVRQHFKNSSCDARSLTIYEIVVRALAD